MLSAIITMSGVAIIPILVTALLPKDRNFFARSAVKGFGLGVYLMLVIVLLREAFELGGAVQSISWFGGGLLVSILIGFAFKEFHHHHGGGDEGGAHHNQASTARILISDFFHNIVDGVAIITGFLISPIVGFTSFLGVLGHQVIQQAGQQVLLVEGGIKAKKALVISFFVSLSIFLGFAIKGNESLEIIFISLSAGIVAWKVGTDLIHSNWNRKTVLGFVTGALILAILLLAIPHTH